MSRWGGWSRDLGGFLCDGPELPQSGSGQVLGGLLGWRAMFNFMCDSFLRAFSCVWLAAWVSAGFTMAEEVPPSEAGGAEEAKADSSYAFGYQMGRQLQEYGIRTGDVDPERLLEGFSAGVDGDEPGISEERVQAAMERVGAMVQERDVQLGVKNLEEGKKFLDENGKREGVVTSASGLQYEILQEGGEEKYVAPKEGEPEKQFMVDYKGTLIDGTEFEASSEGSPVAMSLDVIPGIREALESMAVGARWKLFIPSELAYGDQRRSADIAPNAVLIFELGLVEIKDAPAAPVGGGFPFPTGE